MAKKALIYLCFFAGKLPACMQIGKQHCKIASLVDICGHKKYLKAEINGLTGLTPNFGCVVGGGCKCGSAEDDEKHICCVCSSKSLSSWC